MLLLTGISLAVACGLNAYLPLLILALADLVTDRVDLLVPWNILSSTWGIVILLALLPVELIADKIARVDHMSDLLHSAIRPAAGAIAMVAIMQQDESFNSVGAMIIGLVMAGAVHLLKSGSRKEISVASRGILNPVVSLTEDVAAAIVSIVAIAVPAISLIVAGLALVVLGNVYQSIHRGTSRLFALVPKGPASRE